MNQNRVRDSSHSEERNSPSERRILHVIWLVQCRARHHDKDSYCSPPPREGGAQYTPIDTEYS